MKKKALYKIDFSIDDLSLSQQQQIFKKLIKMLDYDARQNLHVTVTDSIGGKHFIWDGNGERPNGIKCRQCNMIDCEDCLIYQNSKEKNNGAKTSN